MSHPLCRKTAILVYLITSLFAADRAAAQSLGPMQTNSAASCSNWTWWNPVYQPDAESCRNYCIQNGADACEWNTAGECYVEFGTSCTTVGGYPGWYSAVKTSTPPPSNTDTFLVNGSFNESPDWVQPGSAEFSAIAATFGTSPQPWSWTSNSLSEVIPPYYSGILNGGQALANFLNSLPAGEVNLISHSHGGNVVLMSQIWSSRPIRRYIQLATPVNWDFGEWRYALGYTVAGRCQASSKADWKQFFGSSPYQVGNFFYYTYQSVAGAIEAFQSLIGGDYDSAYGWFAQSVFDAWVADSWWDSTKIEVEGDTYMFSGLSHGELHEPPVWNAIAPNCR